MFAFLKFLLALALLIASAYGLYLMTMGSVLVRFAGLEIIANPLVAMAMFCGLALVIGKVYKTIFRTFSALVK